MSVTRKYFKLEDRAIAQFINNNPNTLPNGLLSFFALDLFYDTYHSTYIFCSIKSSKDT